MKKAKVYHYWSVTITSETVNLDQSECRKINSHLEIYTKVKNRHLTVSIVFSGGSSVSQNKLPQLTLGYIYILKYLQSNFIG